VRDFLFFALAMLIFGVLLVVSVRDVLSLSVKRTKADYGRGGWKLWVALAGFIWLGWRIIRPVVETVNSAG